MKSIILIAMLVMSLREDLATMFVNISKRTVSFNKMNTYLFWCIVVLVLYVLCIKASTQVSIVSYNPIHVGKYFNLFYSNIPSIKFAHYY